MYIHIFLCTYLYTRIHISVCMHVYIDICMYIYIYICIRVHTQICTLNKYIYIFIYIYIYIKMSPSHPKSPKTSSFPLRVLSRMYLYIRTHTCTHIYTPILEYMYIYVCIYIYIRMSPSHQKMLNDAQSSYFFCVCPKSCFSLISTHCCGP